MSQPSDALTAQADAAGAFDTLFLGLGAVALLVGAVGVANIMVISVLERRQEIGLRRALGATRGQIRIQFLAEAILLALTGGAAGVVIGAVSTAVYATPRAGRSSSRPKPGPAAWAPPCSSAPLAGLLPAIRAARLSPNRSPLDHVTPQARGPRRMSPTAGTRRPAAAWAERAAEPWYRRRAWSLSIQ